MSTENFFDEQLEQSEVKARIITSYFKVWSTVLLPTVLQQGLKLGYIDLYAGPGRYKDGAMSTPLMILKEAIEDAHLQKTLLAYFNDREAENVSSLKEEIARLPGIEKLKYPPKISCGEIDEGAAAHFNSIRLNPTFSFVDPFGYKGLSLSIIKGVIKDWGCDCVFFFNYARINAGISNENVRVHMNALFGCERADALRQQLQGMSPEFREARILEELAAEIKRLGGTYVLPFTFRNATGTRTKHKLVFVSKSFTGYNIMKRIMAKESSTEDEGVASFAYSPADASMPLLFSLNQPLTALHNSLAADFSGRELTFDQLYEEHSVGRSYVEKHYREVLKALETKGIISARSQKGARRAGTYPKHVLISFQEQ